MGILYIVATPIGNLKDITLRALEVFKEADLILCEDTRQTIKLLNHYQIKKPLLSYFQHSQLTRMDRIASQLAQGKNLALVTDAGTPGISDPGGKLIKYLNESLGPELKITPIPGPCAAIAALSVSGFAADKFIFLGFPPHKKGREKFFSQISQNETTAVFYESSHRILKTMEQLSSSLRKEADPSFYSGRAPQSQDIIVGHGIATLPSVARNDKRQIVVCRELTKAFESIYRGTAENILKILQTDKNNLKGEFVIVIARR